MAGGERGKSAYDYIMSEPEELGEHLGKWIAVAGDGIVASGDDLREVYNNFKAARPGVTPLVMKIPKEQMTLL